MEGRSQGQGNPNRDAQGQPPGFSEACRAGLPGLLRAHLPPTESKQPLLWNNLIKIFAEKGSLVRVPASRSRLLQRCCMLPALDVPPIVNVNAVVPVENQ